MSFGVVVYPIAHKGCVVPEPPIESVEYDDWKREYMRHVLVDVPLGGGGDVWTYWSNPASHLGLPLITSIYDHGLEVEGEQLDALAAEVTLVTRQWATLLAGNDETRSCFDDRWSYEVPLRAHLDHRSELLELAIQVAKVAPGYLTIS